jgi:hypothetical protein
MVLVALEPLTLVDPHDLGASRPRRRKSQHAEYRSRQRKTNADKKRKLSASFRVTGQQQRYQRGAHGLS